MVRAPALVQRLLTLCHIRCAVSPAAGVIADLDAASLMEKVLNKTQKLHNDKIDMDKFTARLSMGSKKPAATMVTPL